MLGILQPHQIEDVLCKGLVGRIGCHADGETYIVPISYTYDDGVIYCHTQEGKKTSIMRKNPNVCFEVDETRDLANWRSVVIQGHYEEVLHPEERRKAMQMLLSRYLPVVSTSTADLGECWPFHAEDIGNINGIFFRIVVKEKTGRYEQSTASPVIPG